MKAIELVFRSQPMVATLREVMKNNCEGKTVDKIIESCDNWLANANELLNRNKKKGGV